MGDIPVPAWGWIEAGTATISLVAGVYVIVRGGQLLAVTRGTGAETGGGYFNIYKWSAYR